MHLILECTFSKFEEDHIILPITKKQIGKGRILLNNSETFSEAICGTEIAVKVEEEEDSELISLKANGKEIMGSKSFILKDATKIEAVFRKKTFTITTKTIGKGQIILQGCKDFNNVPYGTEVYVQTTPEDAYQLVSLTVNGQDITKTKKFITKENVKVEATFKQYILSIKKSIEGDGEILITGVEDINRIPLGTIATIEFKAGRGSVLKEYSIGYKTYKWNGEKYEYDSGLRAIPSHDKTTVKIQKDTQIKAVFEKVTAVEELNNRAGKCYPNPAKDFVIIEGLGANEEVKLCSTNGALVMTAKADEVGKLRLDVSKLPVGFYIIQTKGQRLKLEVKH